MKGNLHQRWLDGVELDYAWRTIPDDDLQAQYDASSDNLRRRQFVISMMKLELARSLLDGKFEAVGVDVGIGTTASLGTIPLHFFAQTEFCDFDRSSVRAYGRLFEQVRVVDYPRVPRRLQNEKIPPSSAEVKSKQSINENSAGAGSMFSPAVAKIGRPPIVPILRDIVCDLAEEGKLHVSPARRVNAVIDRAKVRYPDLFPGKKAPAMNTVRKALREEGYSTSNAQKVQKV